MALGLIEIGGGFSTLCFSCGFACEQRVLQTFPVPGYLYFEDGFARLCHLLVNWCISLTSSSCYGSITLTLGLIWSNGGLGILCHSFGISVKGAKNISQQWVSALQVVQGWGNLTMTFTSKFVYIAHHFVLLTRNPLALDLIGCDGFSSSLCHSCGFGCQQKVLECCLALGISPLRMDLSDFSIYW